jgi:Spy/CpxP family protein refolding chaperone
MSAISKLLATAGLVAVVSATGWAQAPQGPARRPGPGDRGFLAGVSLTDTQRDQIRALREEERAGARDQLQQMRDAQRVLHEEIFADSPNQSKIDGLQQQVTSLSQQLQVRRLELQQRIAQVLTPEQRRYVREHGAERRAFRAGRMMERRMMQRRRPGGAF